MRRDLHLVDELLGRRVAHALVAAGAVTGPDRADWDSTCHAGVGRRACHPYGAARCGPAPCTDPSHADVAAAAGSRPAKV
jgi:hypothetical protein